MKTLPHFLFTATVCLLGFPAILAQKPAPVPAWANRYETVRPSENVFIVSKGGKIGVVSATGASLTKLAYDTIYNFSEGMAVVGRGHRAVNQFGEVLADFKTALPHHNRATSDGQCYRLPETHLPASPRFGGLRVSR